MYKNLRQLMIVASISIPSIALNQAFAQQPAGLAPQIAGLTIKIEEQKARNSSYISKRQAILNDSVKAYENADKSVAAAARNIKELSAAVKEDEKMIAVLEQNLSSSNAIISEKETGLVAASNRSHEAVAGFESLVAQKKQAVDAADKNVVRVKNDSIALFKKSDGEITGLRDSLNDIDRSITRVKREMDSIAAVSATLRQDSASTWKKNDDTLKAALKRLQETRRAIATSDSLVKLKTDEINNLRKDSSGALSSSAKNSRKSEENARRLDSLSRALQVEKTTLYQTQEKFTLDGFIMTLTSELQEMQKNGAAAERIEEKQQVIITNKTKLDNLLRDQKLVAMTAREAKSSPEALNAKITARVIAIDHTLDSITLVQGKISRDNVFQEKEFTEKSKEIIKRSDTLSSFITRTAHEGINRKAQLPKAQKDSAEAAVKRNETAFEYGKKQPSLVAALKNKTGEHESLMRERDALDKKIQLRNSAVRKKLSAVSVPIAAAQKVKNSALVEYIAITARQQKAREDSIAVTGSVQETVKQAHLSAEMKHEELAVKKGRHEQIVSQLKKAQDDYAYAVHEKRQQQVTYQKMLAEIKLKLIEGEQALKEIETQRAVLQKQVGGK